MKKIFITKLPLLTLLILVSTISISCERKDTQKVISNNVSIEAKQVKSQIQKNVELGNNFLNEAKYDEAKQSYEKAISLEKGNKLTYLAIKDKYVEKERLDDAYYIIKSAIKNNVDISNMNKILAQISGNFKVTNVQGYVNQNNKYALPDGVTIKINGVDTKTLVKWSNSSAIDTSKAGNFTYEGNSEEYGRKVNLVLSVVVAVVNEQKPSETIDDVTKEPSGNANNVAVVNSQIYKTKLHNIEIGLKDLTKKESGTTADMREAASEKYKRWDGALNEIYGVLKKQLSSNDMKKLQSEQQQWILTRDAKAKEASLSMKGGTMESILYTTSLADTTKNRCYELVVKYMQ